MAVNSLTPKVILYDPSGNIVSQIESKQVTGDTSGDLAGIPILGKQSTGGSPPFELRVPVVDNNDILKVALYDAPGEVTIKDGGNSITVDFGISTPSVNINNLPYDGQQTMANSLPVAIASDQSSVPVNLSASVPAGTNNIGDVDVLTLPSVVIGIPVGATEVWATAQYTSAQTGVALLTPTSGKKLTITSYQIQVGGTTAGTVQLWFGGSADTTYSRGTDRAIFDGEFAPSATLKPGAIQTKEKGWTAAAVNDVLRVTTSAAINPITFTVWGWEI